MFQPVKKLLLLLLLATPTFGQWSASPPADAGYQDLPAGFLGFLFGDNNEAAFGNGAPDFRIYHDGTDHHLDGVLHGAPINLRAEDAGGAMRALLVGDPDASVDFYYTGTKVFESESDGLDMLSNPISNVADPTDAQDAATRAYVLANAGGASSEWTLGSLVNGTDAGTTAKTLLVTLDFSQNDYAILVFKDDNEETTTEAEINLMWFQEMATTAADGNSLLLIDAIYVHTADNWEFYRAVILRAGASGGPSGTGEDYTLSVSTCDVFIEGDVYYEDTSSTRDCAWAYYYR